MRSFLYLFLILGQLYGQENSLLFDWPKEEWVQATTKDRTETQRIIQIPCWDKASNPADVSKTKIEMLTFDLKHFPVMNSFDKLLEHDISYFHGQSQDGDKLYGYTINNRIRLFFSRFGQLYYIRHESGENKYVLGSLEIRSSGAFTCLSEGLSSRLGVRSGGQSIDCQEQNYDFLTLRLLVACTGEWGENFEKKEDAITSILDNVSAANAFYSKEMNIQFDVIIPDDFIFMDSEIDPFTSNIDSLTINSRNFFRDSAQDIDFDIGHVFHKLPDIGVNAAGAALIGTACSESEKGAGWTGTVDPADINLNLKVTTHEIAHSLGAHHTFYGLGGECGLLGNRHEGHGFEPGSGSSLMAYPGRCDMDNLENNSNGTLYFHTHTINEILEYLNFYRSCGVREGFGIPLDVAIPNDFLLPTGSSFELKATGDGGILYNWEQYDTDSEIPDMASADPINAGYYFDKPVYRSYPPGDRGFYRSFPSSDVVLTGEEYNGEVFTRVPRLLTMRMTARRSGVLSCQEVNINMIDGNPLEVNSPRADTVFELIDSANSISQDDYTIPIEWNVGSTLHPALNYDSVSIYYSTDGGVSFPYLLAEKVPNSGAARVTLPPIDTETGRIKISISNNSEGFTIYDINPGNFSVGFSVTPIIIEKFLGENLEGRHKLYGRIFDPGNEISKIEIERSIDGYQFHSIKELVKSKDSFTSEFITSSSYYYRIAVYLKLGRIQYSRVIELAGLGNQSKKPFFVAPNPLHYKNSSIEFIEDFTCNSGRFYLLDLSGKCIWRHRVNSTDKIYHLPSTLGSGFYILKFECGKEQFMEKLIVP